MIDKDSLKEGLSIEDVKRILTSFGGNPTEIDGGLISDTICHNRPGEGSHKLYYYDNTKLFRCYTGCEEPTFDIFELVIKVFKIQKDTTLQLQDAIRFLIDEYHFTAQELSLGNSEYDDLYDLIDRIQTWSPSETAVLKEYPSNLIDFLPFYAVESWQQLGISKETMLKYNIRYYPPSHKIVIPHYDINSRLIGVRGRAIDEEEAKLYGKYTPLTASGTMYNHPLGYNLYGLNWTKENIQRFRKAILFESEKSVMLADSYFSYNYSAAVCGSNLTNQQLQILLDLGVEEIIIAFDRQYKEYGDEEFHLWFKKIQKIADKCIGYCNVRAIFDKKHRLGYKDSPIDCGPDIFKELLTERISL